MKRNINLMQNSIDLNNDSLNELQKEYILQVLANLGQRIGIKGDGLSYKNFSFLDLLNNENISYNKNEHIGWLKYQKLTDEELIATFGITNIDNGEETMLSNINTKDINDILYASNEIQFTIPINNIEKYSKNSIISNDGNILTIITVGKLLGYEDVDENNGVLLYYKFDIKTNKPIYIAKIGYISSDNSSNYYYALELQRAKNNEGVYINNEYKLIIKIFDSKLLGVYTDTFNNLFMYSAHNNGEDLGFAFLRTDFLDLEEFTAYNEDLNNSYDSNSPLSVIMNNISNNNYYASVELSLYLNSEANEFLYSNKTALKDTISLYKNEYNFIDIEEELYNFNNDITDFYRNFLLYYNDKFFIENRSQFIKRILCKLYETVIDESKSLNNSDNKKYYKMYIPLNYELSYVCNSNNELNIYWSNDIYVLLSNLSKNSLKNDILHKDNYLIFDYNEVDKVQSYRFEIDYNKKYENIINSVNVRRIYSMPFVDVDETWNINGSSTSIRAIGKDAGNPNIIIIYSKSKENKKESYTLINSVSNRDLSSTEFIKEQFQIDNSLFVNITNDVIYCYAWVPKITEVNKELFENSIILNICDLDCLESSLIKDYYLGSNILTIWYYTVENDTYKFKLIEKNGKAMPLGVTENLESIINATTLLDVNENDLLILKAEIETLGQELLSGSNKRWAIIKNKKAKEYNDEYNNDLNAIIEYTDNLKYNISNEKNIISYSQQEPFIKSINDINRENVTNTLYPNYNFTEEYKEITTEEQIDELISKIETTENIKIDIDGDEFTVNKQIYDVVRQMLVRKFVPGVSQISTKVLGIDETNNYLNEYVFNDNVPTIDFKEIFLRNVNTLNKYNILSLDKEGNIYYGYLGSSYELDADKKTLHIGTSTKNINIGTDTLIDKYDFASFKEYDRLSLDFNHISLNATKTLETSSYPYSIKKIRDDEYKVGKYWILDECNDPILLSNGHQMFSVFKSKNENIIEFSGDSRFYNNVNNIQYNSDIYQKGIVEISETSEHNETKHYLICINSVLNNLFGIDLLEKYKEGKIILNIGTNKLVVISNNGNYDALPLFCLLINDTLVSKVIKNVGEYYDNNTIWSTDTLDILIYESVIQDEYNVLKHKNEISIITKFDKYNFVGEVDRYVVWDYDDPYHFKIFPDQNNKEISDFEIISITSRSTNGNEFREISEYTLVPITVTYQCRLIYSDGTYGTVIKTNNIDITDKGFGINDINENEIIRNDKTLKIKRTIQLGSISINPYNEYNNLNAKEVSIPDCEIYVLYNPIDFIPGKLTQTSFTYTYDRSQQAYTTYKDIEYYPISVEPNGRRYEAYVKLRYDIKYVYNEAIYNKLSDEYKNNNLVMDTWAPKYNTTVVATNSSLDENNIISIGDTNLVWHNGITNTSVNIKVPKCDITVGINRYGYYIYLGLEPPVTDNLNLTEVNLIPQYVNSIDPAPDGWRYLIHSLDDLDDYYRIGDYLPEDTDQLQLRYQISGLNGYSPYTEERIIYVALPQGTVLKDDLGSKVNFENTSTGRQIGSFTDNDACPGLVYNIYEFYDDSMGYELYRDNVVLDKLRVKSIVSQNIEETTVELYTDTIIGNGNQYTINGLLHCSLEVKYSDNHIYKIVKDIDIAYENVSCTYNPNNTTLTLTQDMVTIMNNYPNVQFTIPTGPTKHIITMYKDNTGNISIDDTDYWKYIVIPNATLTILPTN